jgi:hypothetical protein
MVLDGLAFTKALRVLQGIVNHTLSLIRHELSTELPS